MKRLFSIPFSFDSCDAVALIIVELFMFPSEKINRFHFILMIATLETSDSYFDIIFCASVSSLSSIEALT